ncbi:pyridoxal phosphate-dependent decarboxylase family protein [Aneurinibacillus sp. REN35]|uniref:pyridoxal phosphate-dependent decarboxylase family protein n=1 Tax=Aneurinibacillus sp. REN35 TaxID=3237286 RepID=UPI003528E9E7
MNPSSIETIARIAKPDGVESLFLNEGEEGQRAYRQAMDMVKEMLATFYSDNEVPYSGKAPKEIERAMKKLALASEDGEDLGVVVSELPSALLRDSIHVTHPRSIAHLHCPPLIPALAAEAVISALNQSMDSWDQSAAATYIEAELIRWLCAQFGFSQEADGTFTSGGTQSNYTGLLLARDAFCKRHWDWDVQQNGLPQEAGRLRILCSEDAHFTVKKSASQLGLGEKAVVVIKTDQNRRLCIRDAEEKIRQMQQKQLIPFAMVATCGTTDFGSIDPMRELAQISARHNLWLHVDAAYGGALVLSQRFRKKLSGIELADSVTVDFHKLFYQPISCGAFLVKDRTSFRFLSHHANYLNPVEDEEAGTLNLVNKSTQTTRRFDALKLVVSLRVVGVKRFGEMIDYTIQLAQETAKKIAEMKNLYMPHAHPELNAVVFRYEPASGRGVDGNQVNRQIYQALLQSGVAIIARTSIDGLAYLKFTLLNPRTTIEDIELILQEIQRLGDTHTVNGG